VRRNLTFGGAAPSLQVRRRRCTTIQLQGSMQSF
jgi:hypothetical protein